MGIIIGREERVDSSQDSGVSRKPLLDSVYCILASVALIIGLVLLVGCTQVVKTDVGESETEKLGKIAFVKNDALWVMDANGANQIRLSSLDKKAHNRFRPCWSPNGNKVLFISTNPPKINVIDVDGQNQTKLSNGHYPSWSPDGKQIVFASFKFNQNIYVISVMDANGKNQKELTHSSFATNPVWSPDGEIITFYGCANISVMHADGTNQRRLTNFNKGTLLAGFLPCWTPDNKKVIFSANNSGGNNDREIFVVATNGQNLIKLTDNKVPDDSPSCSPDGTKIAFSSKRDGNWGIFVMDITLDESGQINNEAVRLTDNQISAGWPCWSPDGSKIIFAAGGV